MCARESETKIGRERKRERERGRDRDGEVGGVFVRVRVCVCACERERGRESMRVVSSMCVYTSTVHSTARPTYAERTATKTTACEIKETTMKERVVSDQTSDGWQPTTI